MEINEIFAKGKLSYASVAWGLDTIALCHPPLLTNAVLCCKNYGTRVKYSFVSPTSSNGMTAQKRVIEIKSTPGKFGKISLPPLVKCKQVWASERGCLVRPWDGLQSRGRQLNSSAHSAVASALQSADESERGRCDYAEKKLRAFISSESQSQLKMIWTTHLMKGAGIV